MKAILPVLCVLSLVGALQADPVNVLVNSLGDNTSVIVLDTRVKASPVVLWKLLTDYDHHSGFLPYMSKSRVALRQGPHTLVDQEGTIRILLWSFTLHVRQGITEDPPTHMRFEAVEGDFTTLKGDWTLMSLGKNPEETSVQCRFTLRPKRRVPDWAVRMAARHYLKKMIAVLSEKAEGSVHE